MTIQEILSNIISWIRTGIPFNVKSSNVRTLLTWMTKRMDVQEPGRLKVLKKEGNLSIEQEIGDRVTGVIENTFVFNAIYLGGNISLLVSYFIITNTGGSNSNPREHVYDDINSVGQLLDDQANQTAGFLQEVTDASDDPEVDSGRAVYLYIGTTVGTLADYIRLTDSELVTILNPPSYRTFEVKDITETLPTASTIGQVVLKRDVGTNITGILFDATFTNYLKRYAEIFAANTPLYFAIANKTQPNTLIASVLDFSFSDGSDTYYIVDINPGITTLEVSIGDYLEVYVDIDVAGQDIDLSSSPVENDYTDIADMLALQVEQTENFLQFVADATADPNYVSIDGITYAFYRYKGIATASLSDYTLLNPTEAAVVVTSSSYRQFIVLNVADSIPSTVPNGRANVQTGAGDIIAMLFDRSFTKYIAGYKTLLDAGKDIYIKAFNKTASGNKFYCAKVTSMVYSNPSNNYFIVSFGTNLTGGVFAATDVMEVWFDLDLVGADIDLSLYQLKSVYDPTNKNTDAFSMDNMVETATKKVFTSVERDKLNGLDSALVLAGTWDASSGTFPGGGTAQAGYTYLISVAGTVDGVVFGLKDRITAIVDNASTSVYAGNWFHEDYTDVSFSSEVNASDAKTTPVDADLFGILDSAASFITKKLSWANIKATLKTYFDTLYRGKNDEIVTASISGTYNIDWSKGAYDLTVTGAVTLTESNLPPAGFEKELLIFETGNFAITYPSAAWSANKSGTRDGTKKNVHAVCAYNSKVTRFVSQLD